MAHAAPSVMAQPDSAFSWSTTSWLGLQGAHGPARVIPVFCVLSGENAMLHQVHSAASPSYYAQAHLEPSVGTAEAERYLLALKKYDFIHFPLVHSVVSFFPPFKGLNNATSSHIYPAKHRKKPFQSPDYKPWSNHSHKLC